MRKLKRNLIYKAITGVIVLLASLIDLSERGEDGY